MNIEDKTKRIIAEIQQEKGCNPVHIFKNMAQKEYISIHGPEHHILDGACILVAFYNAGGDIRLEESLNKVAREAQNARRNVRPLGNLRCHCVCRSRAFNH